MWKVFPLLIGLVGATVFSDGGAVKGVDESRTPVQEQPVDLSDFYDVEQAAESQELFPDAVRTQWNGRLLTPREFEQIDSSEDEFLNNLPRIPFAEDLGGWDVVPEREEEDQKETRKENKEKPEENKAQENKQTEGKEVKKEEVNQEMVDTEVLTVTGEPLVPQKKGQNEFISFVEPIEHKLKQHKNINVLEKRYLSTASRYSEKTPRANSSLLLVAVGSVLCVGLVGTVAGGYILRKRNGAPDDAEYAPYSGVGPFKKGKGSKGDETLAYKAQLHQYQQAKQKIICGEEGPIIESDGEDEADEENNYSVYECPGLAPTGDIEVCNPNFAGQRG